MTRNEFIADTAARYFAKKDYMLTEAVSDATDLADSLEMDNIAPWQSEPPIQHPVQFKTIQIDVLQLNPGDIVLLQGDDTISTERLIEWAKFLKESKTFAGHEVAPIIAGTRIGCLRASQPQQQP